MNILIVEDNLKKYEIIVSSLTTNTDIELSNITQARSHTSARKQLVTNFFDVLILDIQIPMLDDDLPVNDGGIKLLDTIKSSRKIHKPRCIIGLTEFSEAYQTNLSTFSESLISLVQFDYTTNTWEKKLLSQIQYLCDSTSKENTEFDYDLAIICALETPELTEVLNLPGEWVNFKFKTDSTIYRKTTWTTGTTSFKIVAAAAPQMGMVATSVLATKLIHFFHPKYLCMTGICAGVKGKVNLGDIIIADPSWDYAAGKLSKSKTEPYLFQSDIKQLRLDSFLLNLFQTAVSQNLFCNDIVSNWGKTPSTHIKAHIGPVASGPFVLQNKAIIETIKLSTRKLIGIEMEIAGLMYASEHCSGQQPKTFAIKSVCDFADSTKNDEYHQYAAYSSAQYLYLFFTKLLSSYQ